MKTRVSLKYFVNDCRLRLRFEGNCLKQEDKAPFIPSNVVNLLIMYKLDRWSRDY